MKTKTIIIVGIIALLLFTLFLTQCTINPKHQVDLKKCEYYYDGCNSCTVINGTASHCTKIACGSNFVSDFEICTEKLCLSLKPVNLYKPPHCIKQK